jgi:glutamyl-Q tRNA(Asp) synthetase
MAAAAVAPGPIADQTTMMSRHVFRFAPSPNGELHLGHALSALLGSERAKAARGRFLVRVEDIDVARSRPHFVEGIFADLTWLGITWEEPVLFQSRRWAAYQTAARQLQALGLLYPCFATRSEIEDAAVGAPLDPDGGSLYPGLYKDCAPAEIVRRKTAGEPYALRIDVERAIAMAREKRAGAPLTFNQLGDDGVAQSVIARPEIWGDAVIIRKDVPTSYHLAVVVDDAWQGVTHVTRGCDLNAATHLHCLLQVLLDLPQPCYYHHRLITDAAGRKLAKSARDTSLRSLRDQGIQAQDVRRMIGLA